ncbi:restriction endonuclease S subunit [Acetobacter senegalensis DSM 18889]|nr:restriction endonuclease S subunit [Acetobacter senegalensis DSM 18889]
MSFPKYPAYKDSGVEWIGEIPTEWALSRIGSCFAERRQKVSDADYPPLSVTKNGIVPQLETAAKTDNNDNRKCVIAGDFVINSRSDRRGSSGISPQNGSVSLINTVIRPSDRIYSRFSHYLLRSTAFQEEYYKYGKGIVADLWSTNYNEMKLIYLALPPLPEQQTIASFLDRECGKIDALIAEQERLIALLAEKRQAVISHAVTKGLNPNAPMKDSGIPWIGMVPEGWEIVRFSRLVAISEGQVDPRNEQYASMILVAPNHIEAGTGRLREMITAVDQNAESGKYHYQAGAVLYSKIRPSLAKVVIAPVSGLCSADMYPLTSRGKLNHLYLTWLMLSPGFTAWAVMESDRVAMPKINREKLNEIMLPLPPLPEQLEISEYIKNEIINFDTTMNSTRTAIKLLKERRAALISAAVTGKIDVRAQSKAIAA